jgi:hypothetical protein
MPNITRRDRRRNGVRNSRQPPVDVLLVRSSRETSTASVNFPREDMLRSNPSFVLTQTPPRNIRGLIHWIQTLNSASLSVSGGADTESNFAVLLSDWIGATALAAHFDQYCIYAVTASWTPNLGAASVLDTTYGSLTTALDYDNVSNVGSVANLQEYGTALTVQLLPGQSTQRLLKPCVAPGVYGGSSIVQYGVGRCWLDSAGTGIPHYGFRAYFTGASSSAFTVTLTRTAIIGFRNNF